MTMPSVRRWRCLLCTPPRWRSGSYADWQYHYLTMHQDEET